MVSRKVAKLGVKREPGFLYFVDRSGDVWAVTSIKTNIEKKKVLVARAGIQKKPNCLYYLDKNGDVCEVLMNRSGKQKMAREDLAKPTVKYLVYEQMLNNRRFYRSKKVLLATRARNISISVPTVDEENYGVHINYEAKNKGLFSPISKFVSLAKPASNIRIVNKIPRKYLNK
ncbi:hypothetical protein KY335_02705 [Candidatus Woesearchaeota archaeon]|nr:hypothetical protein [Candidatus Woesearchaeota archaeon]MBW3014130.1 hypothetical protein [Candidatus Woesearchaeota archaeon]